MTAYTMIACDGCGDHMSGADKVQSARGARKHAHMNDPGCMTFVAPGSKDFCSRCVAAGRHIPKERKLLFRRAS